MIDIFRFQEDAKIIIFLKKNKDTILENIKDKTLFANLRNAFNIRTLTVLSDNRAELKIALKDDIGIKIYRINKSDFNVTYEGGRDFVMAKKNS